MAATYAVRRWPDVGRGARTRPGSASRSEDLELDAVRVRRGLDEVEPHLVLRVVGEQPTAAAEDHREDLEAQLVDEPGGEQPLGEPQAAGHEERLALALADPGDVVERAEDRGVVPLR